jgi:hypothetical protein
MKLIAEIFAVRDDFAQEKVATIVFDKAENTVSAPNEDKWILSMLDEDRVMGEDQVWLTPKDGEKFMRALPIHFSGSRLRASLREER